MTAALKPPTPAQAADPLAARIAALRDCFGRYQAQITALRAVMVLAEAQGNEAEVETAQVEMTCALAARTCAATHLERLQPAPSTMGA